MTRVLGLDLSLNSAGYSVVEWNGQSATVLAVGHIDHKHKGRQKWSRGKKLLNIFQQLKTVINQWQPDIIVREKGVSRHAAVTQTLFCVVGVSDLLLETCGYPACNEIAISSVKKQITGDGRAEKETVATELQQYLTAPQEFAVDDESDSVAVALAYCMKEGIQ